MIYKFKDVDGKEIGQTTTTSQTLAKEIAKEQGWDWYSIDILEESGEDKMAEPESSVTDTLDEPQKKSRKPRADKGQPRKVNKLLANGLNTPKEKSRKKPEYFVAVNNSLGMGMSKDEAGGVIENCDKDDKVRVIMGHEVQFTRPVKFHF